MLAGRLGDDRGELLRAHVGAGAAPAGDSGGNVAAGGARVLGFVADRALPADKRCHGCLVGIEDGEAVPLHLRLIAADDADFHFLVFGFARLRALISWTEYRRPERLQAFFTKSFVGGFQCPGCLICKIVLGCSCNARLRGLLVVLFGCKISVALIFRPLYLPLVKFIGQQNKQTMENEIAGWPLFWAGFVIVSALAVVVLDWLGGEV